MPNQTLRIILVPGLDDGRYNFLSLVGPWWNRDDVLLLPRYVNWRDGGTYEDKLRQLLDFIDQQLATGDPVALIGISAGASLALNAYVLRLRLVGMVNICGTFRLGGDPPPALSKRTNEIEAYRHSVRACEDHQEDLEPEQLRHILVMAGWWDGIVPRYTVDLTGTAWKRIHGVSHFLSIIIALMFYRKFIVRFLRRSR